MPSKKPHIILDVSKASDKTFFSKFPNAYKDLTDGKVLPVRGGKKYKKEVSKCKNLQRLLNQLNDSGFVINILDSSIDASETTLNASISQTSQKCKNACDDAHLFAMAMHSAANYAISGDSRLACCRRELNQSKTPQAHFSQLGVIKSDKAYKKLKKQQKL